MAGRPKTLTGEGKGLPDFVSLRARPIGEDANGWPPQAIKAGQALNFIPCERPQVALVTITSVNTARRVF